MSRRPLLCYWKLNEGGAWEARLCAATATVWQDDRDRWCVAVTAGFQSRDRDRFNLFIERSRTYQRLETAQRGAEDLLVAVDAWVNGQERR